MYSSSLIIGIHKELAKISEYFLIYKIINLFSGSKGIGIGILLFPLQNLLPSSLIASGGLSANICIILLLNVLKYLLKAISI